MFVAVVIDSRQLVVDVLRNRERSDHKEDQNQSDGQHTGRFVKGVWEFH